MLRASIFILILGFPFAALAKAQLADVPYPTGGDAHGIGGGDPLDGVLSAALGEVTETLSRWTSFKAPKNCPLSLPQGLCQRVLQLSVSQRTQIDQFAKRVAGTLLGNPVKLESVPGSLEYCFEKKCRSVSARTSLSPKGEIQVSRDFVQNQSLDALVALVGHELGHKAPGPDRTHLKDEDLVSSFSSGRAFLDAFGAVLAWRAASVRLPSQPSVALPSGVNRGLYCQAVAAYGVVPVGLSLDLTGKPGKGDLDLLGSRAWREREIKAIFQRVLRRPAAEEETQMMGMLLSREANFTTLLAAIFTDKEYSNRKRLMDDGSFVESFLTDLLGRSPEAGELAVARNQLERLGKATFVLQTVAKGAGVNESRVQGWFRRWLNRPASTEEQNKLVGMLEGGVSWEGAQRAILESSEYQSLQEKRNRRCGVTAHNGGGTQ